MAWLAVAGVDDVEEGEALAVHVDGKSVAIYNVGGAFYATQDMCTHGRASLAEGYLEDHCIECPLHAGVFDVRTGEAVSGPVKQGLRIYPVKVEGDTVMIDT